MGIIAVVSWSAIADSLLVPDSIRQKDKTLESNQLAALQQYINKSGHEIIPGVWLLGGYCNSTIINQSDGIVIIEAPFSSAYGEAIISKAKALYPDKKIKALITTSDAWLHIGGVRAIAAIPAIRIYHPARNRFILEKLLNSTYNTAPDRFAGIRRPSYVLFGITDSLTVGSGNNRLVLYAYRTETGDRQLMVYFPQHKLLYTSDHYQPKDANGKYWNSEIVSEVYNSIRFRKLDVREFYAMHSNGLIPFEVLEKDAGDLD